MSKYCIIALAAAFLLAHGVHAAAVESRAAGAFRSTVMPFFKDHCVKCHGPDKHKGKITLHDIDGDLSAGVDLKRWEKILDVLKHGEMPPEDEPQPNARDRAAVAGWIEAGLRDVVNRGGAADSVSTVRRLTNVEYENTIRDLIGFRLDLMDSLPRDPEKPYRFNNTAEFMRIGPEQIDRYLECARRVMASVIVDPERPEVCKIRREWNGSGADRGLGYDEVGVWGNRRGSAAGGVALKGFPKTGEFRVRIKASAVLPRGVEEVPLRLVMGYALDENSSTLRVEPIGTMHLRNDPDHPEEFEFHGRIENFPPRPARIVKGKLQPEEMQITPQNLYDDGTLNDGERNLAMPRAVVEWIEFEAPLTEVWPPAHHTRVLFDSPLRDSDPKAYVREVLRRFMSRAYRRPATDAEVDRFARIYGMLLPELKTLEAAMRETLAMVLISPQFLYHTTIDDGGTRQYELASKLSYFLWASMPDDELLDLASRGRLDDPHVIERQALRMLADEESRGFIDNFTMQWLSLAKVKNVPINRELFPRFLYYVPRGERAGTETPYLPTVRDYMIQETLGFVAELIRRNASVTSLVDSDFAYLNQRLAVHYGVEGVQGEELRPVPIKPEQRLGGLLTQGAMLIGNGTGSAPHPIYRAVWLREAILGDDVPAPPAEVPALSDSAGASAEKALTIKDLLAKHRTVEACNDCHVRLDPWGIPFERYNAIGQYQPRVPKEGTRVSGFNAKQHGDLAGYRAYVQSLCTEEIHADSRVPNGPEVDGMRDLKAYLLRDRKDEIARNVIRRLLTYGMGRELTYRDRFDVDQLLEQTKGDDYRLRDMIVAICQSNTFRGVKPEEK
ncbi:MAG: DUF1592 domain-containing protein [Phycisphaera sp.]|nr:DUF1592 domain-containing protein [Phycisphaera sp.]